MKIKKKDAIKAYDLGSIEVKEALINLLPSIDFPADYLGKEVMFKGIVTQIDIANDGTRCFTVSPISPVVAFDVVIYEQTNK